MAKVKTKKAKAKIRPQTASDLINLMRPSLYLQEGLRKPPSGEGFLESDLVVWKGRIWLKITSDTLSLARALPIKNVATVTGGKLHKHMKAVWEEWDLLNGKSTQACFS